MIAFKLAYRNLVGAGLRTWLSVFVLSLSFVVIIWHRGFLDGWNEQAKRDMTNWEIAGGQYWQENYDPYDPFTIDDSHGLLPGKLDSLLDGGSLSPILITQATIYPQGRMQSALLKGIDPGQQVVMIPSSKLNGNIAEIPAIIGKRMAKQSKLKIGDLLTVRWRDVNGAFDATEAKIVSIFKCNVPSVDNSQIWIPLEQLQRMLQLPGEASIILAKKEIQNLPKIKGWSFKNRKFLLKDFDDIIKQKEVVGSILYLLLLSLALLAIFDTQVLSVFRRQKEIGTLVALGMTRGQVIRLFTVEGSMHAILAAILGAIYGIPLLYFQAINGIGMPSSTDDFGMAVAERIYPVYGAQLILATVLIIFIAATVVSFIPARKIAGMKPTDAIRGKIQ